jgi:hypothetical protein
MLCLPRQVDGPASTVPSLGCVLGTVPAPDQPAGKKPPLLTAEQKAKLQERNQLVAKIKELRPKGKLADAAPFVALSFAPFSRASHLLR